MRKTSSLLLEHPLTYTHHTLNITIIFKIQLIPLVQVLKTVYPSLPRLLTYLIPEGHVICRSHTIVAIQFAKGELFIQQVFCFG